MPIQNWQEFNTQFKRYIRETFGIFTVEQPDLEYFNLNQFLRRQVYHARNNGQLSMMQVETLMALSTFIDIQENIQNITFDIFPEEVVIQFKTLIENNLIRISPYSSIRLSCVNHMDIEEFAPAVAG
jgi:hypothetical protein